MPTYLNVANEVIAYQGKSFLTALTAIVAKVRKAGADSKHLFEFTMAVDRTIGDYTGISTMTHVAPDDDGIFILSPMLARGNFLSRENADIAKQYDARRQSVSSGKIEGWIDADTGRVSGGFTKLPHEMTIGQDRLFSQKYSDEEIAGKIIHEAGHAYTYLAYAAIFAMRCAALQACHDALLDSGDSAKYKLIVDRTRERLGLSASEVLKKETGTVDKVFTLAASEITEDLLKKDPRGIYTYDTAEELADVFAARHGAGAVLSGLRLKDPNLTDPRSTFAKRRGKLFMLFIVGLAVAINGPLAAISVVFMAAAGASMSFDVIMEIFSPEKSNSAQMIANIKNSMIQAIKEQGKPSKEILQDIEKITGDLEEARKSVSPDMFRELVMFFVPGRNQAVRSRDYNDRLAGMASNDLFVLAAKLKSIKN